MSAMKTKISLVLSGGGARGLAHIGVIEELERQGYEIKSISGTSMGALVGGVYAAGKLQEFKEWMCSLDKLDVFKLIDFSFSSQGLISGNRAFNKMKKFISDVNIEELKIPFVAVATDILNEKEVTFDSGSLFDAVRASVAIPTVLTPVKTENSILVDGGVLNNIPLQHVKRIKGDLLVAVHVNADVTRFKTSKPEKYPAEKSDSKYHTLVKNFRRKLLRINRGPHRNKLGYFELMNKSMSLVSAQVSKLMIEKYPPDILINVSRKSGGIFDFYRAKIFVEEGRRAAIKALEEYPKNN